MPKVKEKKAVEVLTTMLHRMMRSDGKRREDVAKDIDDYASFDLLEYNSHYDKFSDDLKEVMDRCFMLHLWKNDGVYIGKERILGPKDVKEMVERLKKLRK
jgi:hypothetical protein